MNLKNEFCRADYDPRAFWLKDRDEIERRLGQGTQATKAYRTGALGISERRSSTGAQTERIRVSPSVGIFQEPVGLAA